MYPTVESLLTVLVLMLDVFIPIISTLSSSLMASDDRSITSWAMAGFMGAWFAVLLRADLAEREPPATALPFPFIEFDDPARAAARELGPALGWPNICVFTVDLEAERVFRFDVSLIPSRCCSVGLAMQEFKRDDKEKVLGLQ